MGGILNDIKRLLGTGQFTLGPQLERFESRFAELCKTSGAVHSGVPILDPTESFAANFILDSPKSHTFTFMFLSSNRLGDFKSPCMMGGLDVWR